VEEENKGYEQPGKERSLLGVKGQAAWGKVAHYLGSKGGGILNVVKRKQKG